jgi:hypothetical protein
MFRELVQAVEGLGESVIPIALTTDAVPVMVVARTTSMNM